jgi:hypothetical protein
MLLLSSVAVLLGELAGWLDMPILDAASFVLLVGSAAFVTSVIFYHGIAAIREDPTVPAPTPDHGD